MSGIPHSPQGRGPARWCYIDGCRNAATLIVESYPDDITLCDDHRPTFVIGRPSAGQGQ